MSDAEGDLIRRIETLETRLAYQDEAVETLNETITAQWKVIDRLQREVAMLSERLDEAASGAQPVDRPPPHY
ncbi:protein SlyX [Methylopila jiangsuensis]|uniref:Protein SlyX homolog n=1 Tax=Methylopila jiangsuensis TaxID=586230 RepID=A0A9W6JHN7_9HYPH|nr:SlyX family protein [Methylopila jiangsuensis]MDR6287124.1 SlyX protein [Methylopila jiangsuensis]GLK76611.1 protein SlyX [Methylopila jiangsuensis]